MRIFKPFSAKKKVFNVSSVSLDVTKEFYERVVVPTKTCAAETWGMRIDEKHNEDVM